MKDYAVYLFDFDGTTFDSVASLVPVYKKAFNAIGRECKEEDVPIYIHSPLIDLAKELHFEDQYEVFLDEVNKELDVPENLALMKIFPETKEVIEELKKRGKKIAIVSANLTPHIKLVLSSFGMANDFDVIVGSDLYEHHKPNPEALLLSIKKLGLEIGPDICYVGDSDRDIEAASRAGIDGVMIDRQKLYEDLKCNKVKTLKELLS